MARRVRELSSSTRDCGHSGRHRRHRRTALAMGARWAPPRRLLRDSAPRRMSGGTRCPREPDTRARSWAAGSSPPARTTDHALRARPRASRKGGPYGPAYGTPPQGAKPRDKKGRADFCSPFLVLRGDPNEIRTRVTGVRGISPCASTRHFPPSLLFGLCGYRWLWRSQSRFAATYLPHSADNRWRPHTSHR